MPLVYMVLKVDVIQEHYDKLMAHDEDVIAELATIGDNGEGCISVRNEEGHTLWERKQCS